MAPSTLAPATLAPATLPRATLPPTSPAPSTLAPTTVPVAGYTFPFVDVAVSYGTTHHDYPAADVFGCDATVVAPTDGTVLQTRDVDLWDPSIDSPANRGGKFVSMLGKDGVRYYFAHLASVAVESGQSLHGGDPLGVMGQTGNARRSTCHTHMGISWPCDGVEWQVRRGEIWPAPYLDAWRNGDQRSPAAAVAAASQANPASCADAIAAPDAAAA